VRAGAVYVGWEFVDAGFKPVELGALGGAEALSGCDDAAEASKARGSRIELLLLGEELAEKLGGALAGSEDPVGNDGVAGAEGMFGAA